METDKERQTTNLFTLKHCASQRLGIATPLIYYYAFLSSVCFTPLFTLLMTKVLLMKTIHNTFVMSSVNSGVSNTYEFAPNLVLYYPVL